MNPYLKYYDSQNGGGCFDPMFGHGVSEVYVGSRNQRGHGIGSFLGGIFRKAIPIVSRGLRALGKQSLHTGFNVLGDMAKGVPIGHSFKNRVKESGGVLKRKMEEEFDEMMSGSGYKRKRRRIGTQSTTKRKRRRVSKTKNSKKRKPKKRAQKKKRVTKTKKRSSKKTAATKRKKQATLKRRKTVKQRSVVDIFS